MSRSSGDEMRRQWTPGRWAGFGRLTVPTLIWSEVAMDVVWMRRGESRVAHGFYVAELGVGAAEVDSVAWCGRVPVAALHKDELAERCAACVRSLLGTR